MEFTRVRYNDFTLSSFAIQFFSIVFTVDTDATAPVSSPSLSDDLIESVLSDATTLVDSPPHNPPLRRSLMQTLVDSLHPTEMVNDAILVDSPPPTETVIS